ncbi:hypothetical protein [Deinococcus knuensis]|uniref:Glycoside hydrolase family 5 domain-containing protein n=1 Tax=Deinococcus knuensis TaxID=1837380 RepID=A0ABQ2SYS0_9DEIO|nr:hypothetical protein [Deinococcus knuensis]GGS42359.1 hypothetical protein GCM10008961_36940 [Deinococcus knuensis]
MTRPAAPRLPVLLAALLTAALLGGCRSAQGALDASTGAGSLGDGARLLAWQPDLGGPRFLLPSEREGVTDAYLRGEREVAFAAGSGNLEGLRDLFQQGALDDARQAARSGNGGLVTWAHTPTMQFFAPDGATVSFSDVFTYAAPRPGGVSRLSRRELDVVMELGDGNWRVHHWRVLRDDPLPAPPEPGPGPTYRAVRADDDWTARNADTLARDVDAVQELNLDTLILPVVGDRSAGNAARYGAALDAVLTRAAARRVQVLLDLRVAQLDVAGLRTLHAALGADKRDGPRLAGIILSPGRTPDPEMLGVWRQSVRARFAQLPLGLRGKGNGAGLGADFVAGDTQAPVFREVRRPLGRLGAARRGWQLRAFLRAHPRGSVEVGVLYGRPDRAGFLTPDGSFTPLARWTDPQRPAPGLLAWLLGWAADLWPALAGALLGAALLRAWQGRKGQGRTGQGRNGPDQSSQDQAQE